MKHLWELKFRTMTGYKNDITPESQWSLYSTWQECNSIKAYGAFIHPRPWKREVYLLEEDKAQLKQGRDNIRCSNLISQNYSYF